MHSVWTPRVTVAAVIEQQRKFLLVEELEGGRKVLNQPAGHLEEGESLIQAVVRETLEETGRKLQPEAITGLYRWAWTEKNLTFLRLAVCGQVSEPLPDVAIDSDIIGWRWVAVEELRADPTQLRSPLVLTCIEDYLKGQRYPLDLLIDL